MDHYLSAPMRHQRHEDAYLWIGERGRLGASGIYQIIEKRCEAAGVARVHPHQFRHTFAPKMQEGTSMIPT